LNLDAADSAGRDYPLKRTQRPCGCKSGAALMLLAVIGWPVGVAISGLPRGWVSIAVALALYVAVVVGSAVVGKLGGIVAGRLLQRRVTRQFGRHLARHTAVHGS